MLQRGVVRFSTLSVKDVAAFRGATTKAKMGRASSVWQYAQVDDSATLGDRAAVLEHATVGRDCVVGSDSVICSHASLGAGVKVGSKSVIGAGAKVASNATVPDGVQVAAGSQFPAVAATPVASTGSEHIAALAAQAKADWAMSEDELEAKRLIADNPEHAPNHWESYVSSNPNPIKHPERRGLVFNQ